MKKKDDQLDDKIGDKLSALKLNYFVENYQTAAQLATEANLTHLDFLTELVEGELAERDSRTVQRRLSNSKLPCEKTLDQFQWSHPDKINRLQIENLMRLDFVKERKYLSYWRMRHGEKPYYVCADPSGVLKRL